MKKRLFCLLACLTLLCAACAGAEGLTGGTITLNGGDIRVSGAGLSVDGQIVRIQAAGSYTVSGQGNDVQLQIAAPRGEGVELHLNGVTLSCGFGPAIEATVDQLDLIVEEGTENVITDLSARVHSDEKGVHNAAVFASDDLTIRGKGKLSVTSLVGHAVHCKDDLLISGADVTIRSANDGLRGNDAIAVEDSVVSIVADGDGMQTSNDKKGKGNMTLTGSVITITAEKDAFQATGLLQSDGCTLSVRCGEGSVR